jgi:hypothetical protein
MYRQFARDRATAALGKVLFSPPHCGETEGICVGVLRQEVSRLLGAGADPNTVAADDAPVSFKTFLVTLLHGRLRQPRRGQWTSVLGMAIVYDSDVLKLVLDRGANPRLPVDFSGQGALTDVCRTGWSDSGVDVIQDLHLLFEHGADARSPDGTDAAICAACYSIKVLKLLVEHGADCTGKARTGESAVYCAIARQQADALGFLLDHGARISPAEMRDAEQDVVDVLERPAQYRRWSAPSKNDIRHSPWLRKVNAIFRAHRVNMPL